METENWKAPNDQSCVAFQQMNLFIFIINQTLVPIYENDHGQRNIQFSANGFCPCVRLTFEVLYRIVLFITIATGSASLIYFIEFNNSQSDFRISVALLNSSINLVGTNE